MLWKVSRKSVILRSAGVPFPDEGIRERVPDCPAVAPWLVKAACWIMPLLLLSGCGPDPIRVYRAPKENTARVLSWNLPEGWKEETPGEMRAASFSIQGDADRRAEVSIIPLPRITGRDTEFVNLWREQLKLKPIGKEELGSLTSVVEVGGEQGHLFDLIGEEKAADEKYVMRILAATVVVPTATWFVKMTGESGLVGANRAQFVEFLKSLKLPAKPPEGTLAAGTPRRPSGADREQEGSQDDAGSQDRGLPSWEVPKTWKEKAPGPMLLASFSIENAGSGGEITVSAFPGDVGGLLANINRWRTKNLGLPDTSEGELPKLLVDLELPSGKAILVNMANNSSRLLAVIQKNGGKTWFYKLLAAEKIVATEKETFMEFVKSVRYAGN